MLDAVEAGARVGAEALDLAARLDLDVAEAAFAGEQGGVDPLGGEAQVGELRALVGAQLAQRGGDVGAAHQRALAEALRLRARSTLGSLGALMIAPPPLVLTSTALTRLDDAGDRRAADQEHDDDRDQAALGAAAAADGDGRGMPLGARRRLLEHAAELGGERAALGVVGGGGAVQLGRGGRLARVLGPPAAASFASAAASCRAPSTRSLSWQASARAPRRSSQLDSCGGVGLPPSPARVSSPISRPNASYFGTPATRADREPRVNRA